MSKTKKVYEIKKLSMIAGGTGITPMFQIITEIAKIPEDKIEMTLLFCNKTEKDIILRKELEALQPRLKLHLMLEHASLGWQGIKGRPTL
jgi:cytochrome-b5 reductase